MRLAHLLVAAFLANACASPDATDARRAEPDAKGVAYADEEERQIVNTAREGPGQLQVRPGCVWLEEGSGSGTTSILVFDPGSIHRDGPNQVRWEFSSDRSVLRDGDRVVLGGASIPPNRLRSVPAECPDGGEYFWVHQVSSP